MYSSFDAALVTIRHLEELFTPGYPMSLVSRINHIFELLASEKPFKLLSAEGKNKLFSGVCGVGGALQRFKYVYQELTKMITDAGHGLEKTEFTLDTIADATYFDAQLKKSPPKINLVVPFTTLCLDGFSNLQER